MLSAQNLPGVAARRRNPPTRRITVRLAARDGLPDPGDRRALRRAQRLLVCAESRIRFYEIEGIEALIGEAERLGGRDERCLARVLTSRMCVDRIHDRFEPAMHAGRVAIRLWQSLGDAGGEASVRTHITYMLLAASDSDQALSEGLAALTLAEGANDGRATAHALRAVACVYLTISQFDRAITHCERGFEKSREIGDGISEGAFLDTLGCVYGGMAYAATDAGDHESARALNLRAIDLSQQALTIARTCGHRSNEATALANVAEGLVQDGRPIEALALMESGSVDFPASGLSASHHLDTRGSICLALGRLDEAIDLFERAYATSTRSNTSMLALEHAADAYERNGDFAQALAHYKRYHAMFRQVTSEKAQRSASVAAVRLETQQARASASANRSLAEDLQRSNEQLSRRAEDLMHESLHDALTGLGNRRLMKRLLEADASCYAIALVDVDHFKAINDGWSHLIGDAVLHQLATLIRSCCRPADTPIRYGGEEFAVLLREVDEAASQAMAERVRQCIQAFDWEQVAPGLSVTVSIGLAFGFEAADSATVLGLADRRLYDAKDAGRNRLVGRASMT